MLVKEKELTRREKCIESIPRRKEIDRTENR